MVDLIGLIPSVVLIGILGSIYLAIVNKEKIYAELKKWWKNRNEKDD